MITTVYPGSMFLLPLSKEEEMEAQFLLCFPSTADPAVDPVSTTPSMA